MTKILIKPAAEEDLINLWVYIAQDNPTAADRVYEAAETTFETIAFMPNIGTIYQSKWVKLQGIRFFPIKHFPKYIIYYRAIKDGIEIIRVLHGHMEKDRQLRSKS